MGIMIPEHIVFEIKERISIVEVVEDYVKLKKQGSYHKGLCPFHNEKTPSFTVNEGRRFFKCFGCGEYGDVISFLMKIEGMDFTEAVEVLARRASVTIQKEPDSPEQKQNKMEAGRIFNANEAAANFFHEMLINSENGKIARQYLESRGYDKKIIEKFKLGYSLPDWHQNHEELVNKDISINDLHAAGLVIQKDGGKHYDRFRGRLMFPIMDVQGRVRGFGARLLEEKKEEPKYINSPETMIYKKGKGFYGIFQAKDGIRKNGKVVITEGYFDQIALDRSGISFAVATLGTALTQEHARMLRRYSPEVYLVYDPDEAGKKAALRSLEIFLEEGLSPRMVTIPDGKDPDDFLREKSKEDFEELLEGSLPLLVHYMDNLLESAGNSPAQKAKAVGEAAGMVARVRDGIEMAMYIDILSKKSAVPISELKSKIRSPKRKSHTVADNEMPYLIEESVDLSCQQSELDLLSLMIHYPDFILRVDETGIVEKLSHPEIIKLVSNMVRQHKSSGKVDPSQLISEISDKGLVDRVTDAILEDDPFSENVERVMGDVLNQLFHDYLVSRIKYNKTLMHEAEQKGDSNQCIELMRKLQKLETEQKKIAENQSITSFRP